MNTGYWRNWYGNAEGIVREAFIRAIEVSLGAPHKPDQVKLEDIRAEKRREWPIEVFWRCPAPWFESWVTWRGRPNGVVGGVSHSGHVTLHIHTPGHKGSALLTSPLRVPPHNTIDEYREEPANGGPPYLSSEGDRGMWVIAQKNQSLRNKDGSPLTVLTSLYGDWDVPHMPLGAHYVSEGEVVVVQPNEPDGGVRAGGRPYFEGI